MRGKQKVLEKHSAFAKIKLPGKRVKKVGNMLNMKFLDGKSPISV